GRTSFLGILGVDFAEIQHLHNLVDHPCGMVWLKKLVGPDAAKDALALIVLSEYRHRPLPSQRYHEGCRRSMKNRPTRQRQVAGQPQFPRTSPGKRHESLLDRAGGEPGGVPSLPGAEGPPRFRRPQRGAA